MKITDQWLFSAGGRFDLFDVTATQQGAKDLTNDSNLFSYRLGLVYKPLPSVPCDVGAGPWSRPTSISKRQGRDDRRADDHPSSMTVRLNPNVLTRVMGSRVKATPRKPPGIGRVRA